VSCQPKTRPNEATSWIYPIAEFLPVTIPGERDEAIQDLSRARVDAVRARLKAHQQLTALMLRPGRRHSGKNVLVAAARELRR